MALLHKERCSIGARLMTRLWRTESSLVPQTCRKRRWIGTGGNGTLPRRRTQKSEARGMDFGRDPTADVRPLRTLTARGESTSECLAIGVGRHCRGDDVIRVLDELAAIRGAPAPFRRDNGREFVSATVRKWREERGPGTLTIAARSPCQIRIVECFKELLRDVLHSSEIFVTRPETRLLADRRRLPCNHRQIQRPMGKPISAAYAATRRAPPSLLLATHACSAAPPGMDRPTTMHRCL
jgi:putative transposase